MVVTIPHVCEYEVRTCMHMAIQGDIQRVLKLRTLLNGCFLPIGIATKIKATFHTRMSYF